MGKSFNLFLMDGDVTGRMKCTISNWTGLAFKIPRTHLEACKNREDMKYSGIYFLFGKDEANQDEVYIGQAGQRKNGRGVLHRVMEHLKDENYFSEVVILTTQNDYLGPTEISFLENRFTQLARETNRFTVRNGNEPNQGNVTEEKESELQEFMDYAEMTIGIMGYKLFVPMLKMESKENNTESKSLQLFLKRKVSKSGRAIEASCIRTSEGFVVLKASMVEMMDSPSIPQSIKELRKQDKEIGSIINGVLREDRMFNSPSYAASFILGMHVNGRTNWKTAEGQSLKYLEDKEIA